MPTREISGGGQAIDSDSGTSLIRSISSHTVQEKRKAGRLLTFFPFRKGGGECGFQRLEHHLYIRPFIGGFDCTDIEL